MAKTTKLFLTEEEKEYLYSLLKQRTIPAQMVTRAHFLLDKANGNSIRNIAHIYDTTANTVLLCLNKYKKGGIKKALYDDPRPGRPIEITDDAISWIINIACQRPVDLGYSQETWTLTNLHQHIQNNSEQAGFPRLKTVAQSTIEYILKKSDIKPFKINYYCEKRDDNFEEKMHQVLVAYKKVSMQFDDEGNVIVSGRKKMVHTVSCDEKPGIQAIDTTSEDLRPKKIQNETTDSDTKTNKNKGCICRDYEYKRLGTLSLIAGLDLLTGQAIPVVSETHKSSDFICLLKKLNDLYPKKDIIRIICDNHAAHKSKETQAYISSCRKGRFEFVFTPTHGSWLNIIESFFSKMTRQMLKGIRVKSKQELRDRIYLYFEEINKDPVVFHWTYKMDEITIN